jgi:hypothetical protein
MMPMDDDTAPDGAAADEAPLFAPPSMAEPERMVEALLFASADPLSVADLGARLPHGCDPAEALVYLRKRYAGRGVHLVKVGDAWAMRTAPDLGFLMQKETVETRKLSRAAIETLAIIAYHQSIQREVAVAGEVTCTDRCPVFPDSRPRCMIQRDAKLLFGIPCKLCIESHVRDSGFSRPCIRRLALRIY